MTNAAAPSTSKNPGPQATAAEDKSGLRVPLAPIRSTETAGASSGEHPLSWGLRGWSVLVVLALLTEGVSHALRGAFVGTQAWVESTSRASGFASQASAIATGMLLIYIGLMAVRMTRNSYWGMALGLLGAGPTVLIFLAQRFVLNQELAWTAALLASCTMLLAAHQAISQPDIRGILALAGGTMLTAVLRIKFEEEGVLPVVLVALSGIEILLRWTTLLAVVGRQVWRGRQRPWQSTSLIGSAILLAASSHVTTLPNPGDWQLILGRTLNELAPHATFGMAGPLGFSLALLSVIWSLTTAPLSLSRVTVAILALGIFAPTTPLTAAWLTLTAFTVVVICGSPEPSHQTKSA